MSGPPKSVEPSELWTRLAQMDRPTKLVPFPRKDKDGKPVQGDVAIRVLVEAELMGSRKAATRYTDTMFADYKDSDRPKPGNPGYDTIWGNAVVVETLVRACRDPKNHNVNFFPNPDLARMYVTADEFAALFEAYCSWQAESGPLVSAMTTGEMDAWLEKLGEGASMVPLAQLSSAARDTLLLHSAARLRKSLTASGSAGSLPSDSSTSPSPSLSEYEKPPEPVLSDAEK